MHEEQPRNAALDGLRALAVTAVLLFHGGVGWAQGGFLGVDLFFVLSGFLITEMLLNEHRRRGRVHLLHFWSRRAKRLLPGLLVMLTVVVATIHEKAADGITGRLRGDVIATLGDFANWRLSAQGGDYFALQADPSPLDHTWSLAIEGQFYLVWPLVFMAALGIARGRRWLLSVLILLCIGASVAGTALAADRGVDAAALYYRTDVRAQALLVGALLAVAIAHRRGTTAQLQLPARAGLGIMGLVGLIASAALWYEATGSSHWLYRGGLLGAAFAAVLLVAAAAVHPGGLLGRLLGLAPLRWLGRISYGVYLWHWPVDLALTVERTGLHGAALLGVRIATTIAIATASWFVIEQPVRRVARLSQLVLPAALATSLAATVVFAYFMVSFTPPQLAVAEALPVPASVHVTPSAVPSARPTPRATVVPRPVATPTRVRRTPKPPPAPPVVHRPPVPRGPVVPVDVLGDSVADSLGSGLEPIDTSHGARVTNRGIIGCGVAATPRYKLRGQAYDIASTCRDWERQWAADIASDRPKVALVVVGRHEVWDAELNGRWTNIGQADFDAYLAGQLDQAISIASARGARVAMATSPYFHGSARPDGGQYPENDPKRVDRFNVLLRQAVARHPRQAFVVDVGRAACPNGHYTSTVDGVKIRKDGVHFSAAGARYLAPWLFPQLVH